MRRADLGHLVQPKLARCVSRALLVEPFPRATTNLCPRSDGFTQPHSQRQAGWLARTLNGGFRAPKSRPG